MLGGEPMRHRRARGAAAAACGAPVHLGPLGAGEVAKACNQLIVAATILALGEASVLADRSGLDLDRLWSLLGGGYAGSNLLASRRDMLVAGDDSPSGMAKYMVKDLRFADESPRHRHATPCCCRPCGPPSTRLVERGLGDRDIAVTRRFIAERGGPANADGTSRPA